MSMYEELGGKNILDQVVDHHYAQVLLDSELAPWFRKIDMKALRNHQVEFLSMLTGGPGYNGQPLEKAHAGLNVTPEAFLKVLRHLRVALAHFDVPEHIVAFIWEAAQKLQTQIVGK